MNIIGIDFYDSCTAYAFEQEIILSNGDKQRFDVIILEDIKQIINEYDELGMLCVLKYTDFELNQFVWYNKSIFRITNIKNDNIEIYDLLFRETKTVNINKLRQVY